MYALEIEKVVLATIYLERDKDYTEKDLVGNAFVGNKLKELPANKLLEIAQINGYDHWTWTDFEKGGKIKVVFKKVLSEEKICCICHKPFSGYGNNPYPFEGELCCDECNLNTVTPKRLELKKKEIK